jgi:hypothetical protein
MPFTWKLVVAFACPHCGTSSIQNLMKESESNDHRAVAEAARFQPTICPTCKKMAPPKTPIHVHVAHVPGATHIRPKRYPGGATRPAYTIG